MDRTNEVFPTLPYLVYTAKVCSLKDSQAHFCIFIRIREAVEELPNYQSEAPKDSIESRTSLKLSKFESSSLNSFSFFAGATLSSSLSRLSRSS